ncbi:hypothetical protein NEOC95_000148 [Neochlamydia sp. AcF95]|nr:hypothetical protein [Neochlamydia sp. AcF95]
MSSYFHAETPYLKKKESKARMNICCKAPLIKKII